MNVKEKVKQLNLVYKVLGAMQVFMGVAVYFLVQNQKPDYSTAIVLQKISLVMIPGLLAAGYFLYKYLLSKLDMKTRLDEKVNRYFTLVIIRAAFLESAFVFCCVASAITGVQLFLYMTPIVFLLFLLMRPNPSDMKSDLQLSESDAIKIFEK